MLHSPKICYFKVIKYPISNKNSQYSGGQSRKIRISVWSPTPTAPHKSNLKNRWTLARDEVLILQSLGTWRAIPCLISPADGPVGKSVAIDVPHWLPNPSHSVVWWMSGYDDGQSVSI